MFSVTNVLFAIGILLLLHWIWNIVHRLLISPLKSIPGPWIYAVTSIPHDIACIKGIRHKVLEELHEKYGPVVRISPTEVSFINDAVWKDVWGFRKNDAECPKSDLMERVNGFTGILDAGRLDHRRFRRLLSHAFSEQSLRGQEKRVHQHVDLLVQGLRNTSQKGPLDITLWMHWTTFDIMGDLAFGQSFKSLEAMKTHPWQQFLADYIAAAVWSGIAERWGLAKLIAVVTPASLRQAVQDFYELSSQMIEKRIVFGKERGDFFDHILKHEVLSDDTKMQGELKGLRHGELKSIASDLAVAGSETTATLLSGLWYFLSLNPPVLAKLVAEIRTFESEDDINFANIAKLEYLNAVIDEALRCFVPSPIPSGRNIPTGGVTVGEVYLPEGTTAFVSHHIAYTSPMHFARPKEFIPDRWIEGKPKEFQHDNESVYRPFAYGPRNCIGTHLARAEMRLIISKVLWHFDLERPDPSTEKGHDWESWMDRARVYFLWHKPPLMVNLTPRLR
ncbi:toxin biosynthesis cytochrome P450 monooxygenase [Aaosphaeria arxii CBS 175.79]|uniref:Toxin biosynthesis cytochrome P450 monooxygenase n=1 Tax=Aaosphaeria arxii CBS 175.79 TaxID=1450172 RepID=A0A6A5X9P8_9PLEO|nr:toxin biosynthesis cytochrome P450 monooxygenase [Aaosphaeria arxii CBS 175.79]KAF2009663.1 toxin biosynthesis cytochrome P450 monooxygenase [Aaosphaeria arxii CBS 175.79]